MCSPESNCPKDIPAHGYSELKEVCAGPVEVCATNQPGEEQMVTMCRMEYISLKQRYPNCVGSLAIRNVIPEMVTDRVKREVYLNLTREYSTS